MQMRRMYESRDPSARAQQYYRDAQESHKAGFHEFGAILSQMARVEADRAKYRKERLAVDDSVEE